MSRLWLLYCERRGIWWAPDSAGYTDDVDQAGRYTDASALNVAERMNGGGDSPVRLVPAADAERFIEERTRRGGIAIGVPASDSRAASYQRLVIAAKAVKADLLSITLRCAENLHSRSPGVRALAAQLHKWADDAEQLLATALRDLREDE